MIMSSMFPIKWEIPPLNRYLNKIPNQRKRKSSQNLSRKKLKKSQQKMQKMQNHSHRKKKKNKLRKNLSPNKRNPSNNNSSNNNSSRYKVKVLSRILYFSLREL